ncbi:MAG TPA: hypothetical protein EYG40_06345 [Verrucomicrobia bacterium]|nr:hypothetical protein [Verrucomicrobiales bacterium]HIL54641.1 hypothetical protein [Verrucomicrobiota bacterium]
MTENSDFDEDAPSEGAVEDSTLRMDEKDNLTNDDTKTRSVESKKSKATLNYGIVAAILILSSLALGFVTDLNFAITPFAIGVTILGMTYYSWKRRRDCSDKGIIFYSHSQIMYLWPIWLGAFVISDFTSFFANFHRKLEGEVFALPGVTLLHLVVMAVVIFFTSVNLRGVWAAVFAVSAVALGLAFSVWDVWEPILRRLGDLKLYVNSDFYRAMGVVIFIPWLFVVFIFDLRRYFHFRPSQVTMVHEIGEGEKTFDSFGVVMEKHRDNYVQHIALGFGSGDLSISTHGGDSDIITFRNVLRINRVLKDVSKIREKRGRSEV